MITPRSILQLTITGFLAVTGILIAALIITIQQLEGLSDRSQRAVYQTTIAMDASRSLMEQSTAMERNARQYSIVGDQGILQVYKERHSVFVAAAARLGALELNDELTDNVARIQQIEDSIFQQINNLSTAGIEEGYQTLLLEAARVAEAVNRWANGQVLSIQQESSETRNWLTVQAIVLVAAAVLLAGVFTALITRPLIQVEKAIERLGQGGYNEAVNISGPRDLVKLGKRLEWLRERLSKLEQQRTSFLRHVSHELKTPLAAIQESTSLFKDGIVGELSDEQKKLIQIQSNSTQRLHHIIDDLLRHHESNLAEINTQPQAIALDKMIAQEIVDHKPNTLAKSLNLDVLLDAVRIYGNPEQVRVIVGNLLSNAIRFSPEGGHIKISLQAKGDAAIVTVIDQGPGIPEQEREQIFEAFYQGKQPLNSNYKGSGLGLAIAQEYVNANAGSISVLPSDTGACFELRFPFAGKPVKAVQ